MEKKFNPEDFEKAIDTVEVMVPNASEVRRKFSEFVPMIVSILAMINILVTSMTGKELIPFADDQVYLVVSGVVSVGAILWTAWKNTSFSKKAKQREEIANQVISKPKVKDIIKNKDWSKQIWLRKISEKY